MLLIHSLSIGGRGHLDIQPHWVTALAFPQHKGPMEGCMGLTTDMLLMLLIHSHH